MDKTTALAIIEERGKDPNALVFAKPEDVQTQKMFVPQITTLHGTPDDFHNISGKMMPKSYHVDRIGQAAGVDFTENCGTRKESDTCYVGYAQGRKRMPDGTWRTSSVQEYEFDVEVRFTEDVLKDKNYKYKNDDVARSLHKNELMKFARARASTGARLRVIRELTGIPSTFDKNDIHKAFVIVRVALNTDGMLKDPTTRQAAIAHATGAVAGVYGPAAPIEVTATAEVVEVEEAEAVEENPFAEDVPADPPAERTEVEELKLKLEEWLLSPAVQHHTPNNGPSAKTVIEKALADEDAKAEQLQSIIARCEALQKQSGRG